MILGILGGGQLARMLALAGYPLGIDTVCIDNNPRACAGDVTKVITADFSDTVVLDQFLATVDCVTFETENIPTNCVEYVATRKPVQPGLRALEITQDRLQEKDFLQSLQIPTANFSAINSLADLTSAVEQHGYPSVLKTRRFGYDGKGQYLIKSAQDVSAAWDRLNSSALILEKFVPFEFECSVIAVRNQQAETVFYPLARNHHKAGILRNSELLINHCNLQSTAAHYAEKVMTALDYVGVMTIEFFYADNQLIANEIAPRVHNSGHWTIEGANSSQFENHLRALFNLPMGSTEALGHCYLTNCIGRMPSAKKCLQIPGLHYHTYGKEPRPNRKLGHLNLVSKDIKDHQRYKTMLMEQLLYQIGS